MKQYSRIAITEAFVKLLNERPLNKISVKDIVDMCDINRKTFYYYFDDIYDLLKKVFEERARLNLSHLPEEERDMEKTILLTADFILKNKKAVYHVYNSLSRETLQKHLYISAYGAFFDHIESQVEASGAKPEDIELAAKMYSWMFIELIFEWLENGMKTEPEQVLKRISKMLEGSVELMFRNLAEFDSKSINQ